MKMLNIKWYGTIVISNVNECRAQLNQNVAITLTNAPFIEELVALHKDHNHNIVVHTSIYGCDGRMRTLLIASSTNEEAIGA